MTDQQKALIMQRIAELIVVAADLQRAVATDDGTYIRSDLGRIEAHRAEVLMMIYDAEPALLQS